MLKDDDTYYNIVMKIPKICIFNMKIVECDEEKIDLFMQNWPQAGGTLKFKLFNYMRYDYYTEYWLLGKCWS